MNRLAIYMSRETTTNIMSYAQQQQEQQEQEQQTLLNLSYVVINNSIQFKMDKIADLYIHGLPYFTVFRRYNSPYEFVLEDMNGDTYLHRDQTVRESLQAVLCLSPQHAAQLYTHSAHSYKHNAPLCPFASDLADLQWSAIQEHYEAISANFGGVLLEFQDSCEQYAKTKEQKEAPHTPVKQEKPRVVPDAPLRTKPRNVIIYDNSSQETQYSETIQDEPWSVLVPVTEESLVPRITHDRNLICYCECKEEDDQDDQEEQEQDFTVLRDGTRIRKIQTKSQQVSQKRQKH